MDGPILAIDPGARYVGFALSDEERKLAFPHAVVDTKKQDLWSELETLLGEKSVQHIIVGFPVSLRGGVLPMTKKADELVHTLTKRFSVTVERVDERMSTKQVTSPGSSGKRVDAQAAAVLLQAYLDAQR